MVSADRNIEHGMFGCALDAWLAYLRCGDQAYFADFIHSVEHPLRRFMAGCLWNTAARGEIDDCVAESIVRLYRCRASFDIRRPLTPWVKKIARNVAIDAIKRVSEERKLFEIVNQISESNDDDGFPNLERLTKKLLLCLQALDDRQRYVIELRFMRDTQYNHAKIASDLGITANHSRQIQNVAFQQLRDCISSE